MNRDVMELWVAALRSEEYTQTQNYLRDDDGMCCLGVLCDLYKSEDLSAEWEQGDDCSVYAYTIDATDDWEEELPPFEVCKWAGLRTREGHVNPNDSCSQCLSALNDSGYTFAQLADIIEKNWETL